MSARESRPQAKSDENSSRAREFVRPSPTTEANRANKIAIDKSRKNSESQRRSSDDFPKRNYSP